ncbi:MAG: ABC transporter permease [Rhodocyclaceae bacterium]|jgi:NitT/TauT family transport system permease protein|nr:ABC transporter permease [Rhodocyclaceae bacterium]MCA3073032.1 ABC transporter permease [Rhodocyclaceae bacterium]MCA3088692.1 ABC transporter permease [Rhodocyclaceae bacterium]MCA3092524.1 ABC transporter permease [Rhodocyclaceae bacterium]MCA3097356.1 ABC transporter permease [Rhodocyclaceae bacterium]
MKMNASLLANRYVIKAFPVVFVALIFIAWELLVVLTGIKSVILPPPSAVIYDLVTKFPLIWPHAVQTLYTTMVGFLGAIVVGVLLGALIGSSRLAYEAFYPVLIGFSSIPKVAVVPIFVLWFGVGTIPAILTSLVISFFPIVVNVATGLATTEPELEDVLRALGAKKRDILLKVGLPRAMPYFFASLKISVTLAFVGTVLSETVAANKGIGNVMMVASANYQTALAFGALLLLAIMGVILYGVFALLETRFAGWSQRKADLALQSH